jgi:hypothetical protein
VASSLRRGQTTEAEALAQAAVALAETGDHAIVRAGALVDFAEVLAHSSRATEATAHGREALHLYQRKGDAASAARAQETLARLGACASTSSAAE